MRKSTSSSVVSASELRASTSAMGREPLGRPATSATASTPALSRPGLGTPGSSQQPLPPLSRSRTDPQPFMAPRASTANLSAMRESHSAVNSFNPPSLPMYPVGALLDSTEKLSALLPTARQGTAAAGLLGAHSWGQVFSSSAELLDVEGQLQGYANSLNAILRQCNDGQAFARLWTEYVRLLHQQQALQLHVLEQFFRADQERALEGTLRRMHAQIVAEKEAVAAEVTRVKQEEIDALQAQFEAEMQALKRRHGADRKASAAEAERLAREKAAAEEARGRVERTIDQYRRELEAEAAQHRITGAKLAEAVDRGDEMQRLAETWEKKHAVKEETNALLQRDLLALRQKLKQKSEAADEFERDAKRYRGQAEEFGARVQELEARFQVQLRAVAELQARLRSYEKIIADKDARATEMQRAIDEGQTALDAEQARASTLRRDLALSEDALAAVRSEFTAHRAHASETEAALRAQEQKLKAELAEAERLLAELKARLRVAEAAVSEKGAELQRALGDERRRQEEERAGFELEIRELRTRVAAAESKISEMQIEARMNGAQMKALQSALADANKNLERLQEAKAAADAEARRRIERLQAELEEAQRELRERRAREAELQARLDELTSGTTGLAAQLEDAKRALGEERAEAGRLRGEEARLRDELAAALAEVERIKMSLAVYLEEYNAVKRARDDLEAEKRLLEERAALLKADGERRVQEVTREWRTRAEALDEEWRGKYTSERREAAEAREKCARAEKERDAAAAEAREANAARDAFAVQLSATEQRVRALEAENAELRQQLEQALLRAAQLEGVMAELRPLQLALEERDEELRALRSRLSDADLLAELQKALAAEREVVEELQRELAAARAALAAVPGDSVSGAEAEALQRRLQELEGEVGRLRPEAEGLRAEVEALRGEAERGAEAARALAEALAEVEKLRLALALALQKSAEMEGTIDEARDAVEAKRRAEEEARRLSEQAAALNAELAAALARAAALRALAEREAPVPRSLFHQLADQHLKKSGVTLSKKAVLKLIAQTYVDKMKADAVDDREVHRRQDLHEFVMDAFLFRYGVKEKAEEKLAELLCAAREYAAECPRIRAFASFLGLTDTKRSPDALDAYLLAVGCLQGLIGGGAPLFSEGNWEAGDANGAVLVPAQMAVEGLPGALFPGMVPEHRAELAARIRDAAVESGKAPKKRTTVDLDELLEIALQAWQLESGRAQARLYALFTSADRSQRGVITLQEFAGVVKAANGELSDGAVSYMFREALLHPTCTRTRAELGVTADAFAYVLGRHRALAAGEKPAPPETVAAFTEANWALLERFYGAQRGALWEQLQAVVAAVARLADSPADGSEAVRRLLRRVDALPDTLAGRRGTFEAAAEAHRQLLADLNACLFRLLAAGGPAPPLERGAAGGLGPLAPPTAALESFVPAEARPPTPRPSPRPTSPSAPPPAVSPRRRARRGAQPAPSIPSLVVPTGSGPAGPGSARAPSSRGLEGAAPLSARRQSLAPASGPLPSSSGRRPSLSGPPTPAGAPPALNSARRPSLGGTG
eukprot:tig00001374_g8495.t1